MYTYSNLLKQARLSNLLDMNEFAFFFVFVILFSNNPFWGQDTSWNDTLRLLFFDARELQRPKVRVYNSFTTHKG